MILVLFIKMVLLSFKDFCLRIKYIKCVIYLHVIFSIDTWQNKVQCMYKSLTYKKIKTKQCLM